MASTSNEATPETATTATNTEELTIKAVHKRYEGLLTVKTKAIKGKGAWYWQHLEPILLHSEIGVPKAVKLKCSLCQAVFSASNPSRTASEHLKRGTCPNFQSPSSTQSHMQTSPQPISSVPPPTICRKRSTSSLQIGPLALMDLSNVHGGSDVIYSSSSTPQHHFVLSGGKDDLGAFALLEDSVKKLKSPKADPCPSLSISQVDSAISLLSDWFYESSNYASITTINHPKFQAFLHQVGLPSISPRELISTRLDAKYEEARLDSENRIRDALFFQLSCDGWKSQCPDSLISITVNLPNGTTVFRKVVLKHGQVPSNYVEEILWENITEICGSEVSRCVGIVSDKFNSKALRSIENQNHWMVNLSCQIQGFTSLIKDFKNSVPWFGTILNDCSRVSNFFNTNTQARHIFHKYQLQEFEYSTLLRVDNVNVFPMLDDIYTSARPLRLTVLDDSYKLLCLEDSNVREIGELVNGMAFWANLEAVHSFITIVNETVKSMKSERPFVSQCLPLWEELKSKIKDWCSKFNIDEILVKQVVDKRFKKNYHPAWAAAFVLDPLYLVKDASGCYLPPFRYLTSEQEKDVDKLITRLVSREEAHIVLMELMKWRTEGLDPLYAQAVQLKQLDPRTNKMKIANPQSGRLVWETYLKDGFKSLSKVAVRLIFLHATSYGYRCNGSMVKWVCRHGKSREGMERVKKLVFVAAHSKLERRDFSSEEEKEDELFGDEDDDVLNEGYGDPSSSL